MTIYELLDYLTKYADRGKGEAFVMTCDHRDNPLTDANCIKDALFIDSMNGDFLVVLQTE